MNYIDYITRLFKMNLDQILAKPPKGYWLSSLDLLRKDLSPLSVIGHQLDQICELVSTEARLGRGGRVTNWLTLGLFLDPNRFVSRIKRTGALRASKYDFDVRQIAKSVETILAANDLL